jgi:prepilin peptidase CpaA
MRTPALQLATFLALLAVAAGSDLALRRVPNWTSVAIASAGLAFQVVGFGPTAALSALAVALLVGVVLALPWRAGLMGGGDLKLAVACAAWLGPSRVVPFALAAALAGGVLALPHVGTVVLRGRAGVVAGTSRSVVAGALHGATGRRQIPYGVAIAAGAAVAMVGGWS